MVLDSQNTVQYTEYLENINESPNYEKPIEVVKSLYVCVLRTSYTIDILVILISTKVRGKEC